MLKEIKLKLPKKKEKQEVLSNELAEIEKSYLLEMEIGIVDREFRRWAHS